MAKTPSATAALTEPAQLLKPRDEVKARLQARLDDGVTLMNRSIETRTELGQLGSDVSTWHEYNHEYLRRAFTTQEIATSYAASGIVSYKLSPSFSEEIKYQRDRISSRCQKLQSIIQRLELIDERENVRGTTPSKQSMATSIAAEGKVFLVHGQDEAAKAMVARFITDCGLNPIILHERANVGSTIIEKFEREADVGFAIVVLTPDDVGGVRDADSLSSSDLKLRARQNVILELGYFVGRLGRKNVAALKKGDIELPTDISGVVWTSLDDLGSWKLAVVRELKAAHYEVDFEKALGLKH